MELKLNEETQASGNQKGSSGLAGLVMRTGLAKDEVGARKILMIILAAALLFLVVFWWPTGGASTDGVLPPTP